MGYLPTLIVATFQSRKDIHTQTRTTVWITKTNSANPVLLDIPGGFIHACAQVIRRPRTSGTPTLQPRNTLTHKFTTITDKAIKKTDHLSESIL